jgi:hypothetical protein
MEEITIAGMQPGDMVQLSRNTVYKKLRLQVS